MSEFEKRYKKLNPSQRQAVDAIEGPVMVVAGPGTGKTELLGVRAANILKQTDTLPENILCLTFTDSGVGAMRERLIDIIGKDAYKISVHTFHSFGIEIINQNREFFYNGAIFSPADDVARYQILKSIFDELDYNNPLRSSMNGEYTHLRDVTNSISDLKRSGLTSDELLAVISANQKSAIEMEKVIVPIITGTINKSTHQKLFEALDRLRGIAEAEETIFSVEPLCKILIASLEIALNEAATVHPTKPITAWKNRWFAKDSSGGYVLKSSRYNDKLKALSFVYFKYITKMEQAGLYDYDDMILQVVHALEVNDDLRFNLQEKYLYVMIDEFQDTNLAQMRVIKSLANSTVNEGRPNIMIVGDDDQAIYSFQGADLSNIAQFLDTFPESKIISLRDNYRSTGLILNHSRTVITQSRERLENTIEYLNKELDASREGDTSLSIDAYLSAAEEKADIARRVRELIDGGTPASEIAILTRKHKEIESLLPYLSHFGVRVSYERQDNALDLPPVKILEKLALVIKHIADGKPQNAESHLPELLSHPAWGHDSADIWRLSLKSYQNHTLWLEQMEQEEKWQPLQTMLVLLAGLSLTTPLEQTLDLLMGKEQTKDISMPFFDYFFSNDSLDKNPADYLYYLTGLRRIRSAVQDHKIGEQVSLSHFVELLELYKRLSIPINISQQGSDSQDAINLMTAHKSKGLEFDTVFIVNAIDSVWGEKVRSPIKLIRYPENLPLGYAGDSIDERIRLFYVAMTRAKNNLHISYSLEDDKGKSTIITSFLSEHEPTKHTAESSIEPKQLSELAWNQPILQQDSDLKDALKPYMSSYKLSATHLNSFMDLTRGGPQSFLIDKLLHFPSAKSSAACYGSVIHKTLQQAHLHVLVNDKQKPLEDIAHDFEVNLSKERLDKNDYETYLQKGYNELRLFIESRPNLFSKSQKTELNFNNQNVVVRDVKLTGVIDLVDIDSSSKTIKVVDFKTGKPLDSWDKGAEYDKIKAYKYHQQLLFYKILIENSRDFGNLTVTKGSLEFVEPGAANQQVSLSIDYDDEQIERLKLLMQSVWQHIQHLDFPDISGYEPNLRGILQFEDDLINSAATP